MKKTLVVIVLSVILNVPMLCAQKNKQESAPIVTEWADADIFEQNKLYPHVNVVGYKYENDIEKGAYRSSPYYVSLSGKWQYDIQTSVSARPDVETKKFDPSLWSRITVPNGQWQKEGKIVNVPQISNVVDLPDKGNPIVTYYREFNVSDTWKGYEAFLQVQAKSAYYIWINKKYVGYSEDSRSLSEFNITSHLQYGRTNTIAIQVIGLSDGSLLECDYASSYNGITHDVAIVLKPEVNVNDYKLRTSYNPETHIGELQITASVANKNKKGLYYLEAEIWSPQGKVVDKMAKWVAFDKRSEVDATMKRDFQNIQPWSAETPNLYTVVLRLRDNNMNLIESTGSRFGFRSLVLSDNQLLVNGDPIKLRGVAYSNYDINTGTEPTYDQMEKDLCLMKRYNINAIRTSVYSPADDEFYSLCDKYGFYVICEANIQPYSTQKKAVSTDADYENLFISRVQNMYEPLKNHPSILIWSLGSGLDNGVCMERAYAVLKQKDKDRPILFAGAGYSENTDIVAITETAPDAIKVHSVKKQSRPILLYSFGSIKGNGFGGMEPVWRMVADNSKFLGGFVEWWTPVVKHNQANETDEVEDGLLIDSKRQIPALLELANLYNPFDVRLVGISQDACEFIISSVSGLQSMGSYVLEYNMFSNLKPHIVGGEMDMTLAPGESKKFKLKMPSLNLYIGEELFMRFSVKQRLKSLSVPQGTTLASIEMSLPIKRLEKMQYESAESISATVESAIGDKKGVLVLKGSRFLLKYNLDEASITKYTYDGVDFISAPPLATIVRAATDNDILDRNGSRNWHNFSSDNLVRTVQAVNYRQTGDGSVTIDAMVGSKEKDGRPVYDINQTIGVLASGDVIIDNSVVIDNTIKCVPRVGFEFAIPKQFDDVSWFGMGHETYIDRSSWGDIGTHKQKVNKMTFEYNRPQSSGNHAQTRWLSLSKGSHALFVDMIDTSFNFSISPYSDSKLASANSYSSLKPGENNILHVDYKMAGVGSAVAGYPLPDVALIKDKKLRFKIHLRAFNVNDNDPEDFRRISYPNVESGVLPMPVIGKNRDRFNAPMLITITTPTPDATIRYTLDGSDPTENSPIYKSPIQINASTIVSARAFKSGFAQSFVARNHYSFDYVKSTTFEHKPNTPYNYHYQMALFDAEYGDVNNLSSSWIGFSASDLSVVLELSKSIELESVELRFAHNPDAWAFAPSAVNVYVSTDGVTYSEAIPAQITYDPKSETMNATQLANIVVYVDRPDVKYVKVQAKNLGRIPSWHKNKGLRPWLMTDEIKLNEVIRH